MNRYAIAIPPLAAREIGNAKAFSHSVNQFPIEGFRFHARILDDLSNTVKDFLAQFVQLNNALKMLKISHAHTRRRSTIQ